MALIEKRILSAVIALFVLLGIFVFLYHRNCVKSKEIEQYKQNWVAANDSVKYYKLKNGELMAERASFILSEADMKEQLEMTDSELRELKKKLGSTLNQLAKVQSEVHVDSIYIISGPDTIGTDFISAPFHYSDEWLSISGRFECRPGVVCTLLSEINLPIPLTIGSSMNNKFFASTPNPYVRITEINSVVTPQKKKHFGIGLNIGPSVGWNLITMRPYVGLGLNIGINYNF